MRFSSHVFVVVRWHAVTWIRLIRIPRRGSIAMYDTLFWACVASRAVASHRPWPRRCTDTGARLRRDRDRREVDCECRARAAALRIDCCWRWRSRAPSTHARAHRVCRNRAARARTARARDRDCGLRARSHPIESALWRDADRCESLRRIAASPVAHHPTREVAWRARRDHRRSFGRVATVLEQAIVESVARLMSVARLRFAQQELVEAPEQLRAS